MDINGFFDFSFVLADVSYKDNTVTNCLKILIRMARTSLTSIDSIMIHGKLMDNIFRVFNHHPLGDDARLHNAAKELILKLWRVILGYGGRYVDHLLGMGIETALRSSIFLQENNVTVSLLSFICNVSFL